MLVIKEGVVDYVPVILVLASINSSNLLPFLLSATGGEDFVGSQDKPQAAVLVLHPRNSKHRVRYRVRLLGVSHDAK